MTTDHVHIQHKLNYNMYTYSWHNFEIPQCSWHLIELIYSSHSLLITIQLILMLQNKILRKKCTIYDPVLDRRSEIIIPKRFRCVTRSIAIANVYGVSHLTQLYWAKLNMGKPYNTEYIPWLPPLKMDLNIQWCGSLPWIWKDKESLINGTRGVKILPCDGKHMEFSTVQPKNWQGLSSPLPAVLFLCSSRFCQLESTGCAVFPLSPKRWSLLCH